MNNFEIVTVDKGVIAENMAKAMVMNAILCPDVIKLPVKDGFFFNASKFVSQFRVDINVFLRSPGFMRRCGELILESLGGLSKENDFVRVSGSDIWLYNELLMDLCDWVSLDSFLFEYVIIRKGIDNTFIDELDDICDYSDAITRDDNSGYVYIMSSDGKYKIGVTQSSVQSRLKQLQAGNPNHIELVDYIYVNDCYVNERLLHDRFKDKKVRGEWFKLNQNDLIDIKRILTIESAQQITGE